MFKRKHKQWISIAQSTDFPLRLIEFEPREEQKILASFLRQKIGEKELNGFVTPDNDSYVPTDFIQQKISQQINTTGVVDICDLIDDTNLPGEVLEHQILLNVQNIDGFFDLIKRKFFTPRGSIREIKQIMGKTRTIELKYLLNRLYWTEKHIEGVLDLMAQKDQFIGYIDPIKQRLYNFTYLDFSTSANQQKNFKYLKRFINTCFLLESEVSIAHICNLTRLSDVECLDLLEPNRDRLGFVFSSDFIYIYPTINIVFQILKDMYIYHKVPIEFWQKRLDVDRKDFLILLRILNQSLMGIITRDDFEAPSLKKWFKKGIDIEGLASSLNLKTLEFLEEINKIGNILGLRITAGDTSDPFLVKGVEHFEIFCQVDTSHYSDPHLYFECQNCKRMMCSNCRSTGSKHDCPFCGNISAFIIDLPRYCPYCQINYTHSFNLVKAEQCYFCNKSPLKVGWNEKIIKTEKMLKINPNLAEFFKQSTAMKIPIQQIINLLNLPDSEAITLLENYIFYGLIQGWIDIREMKLNMITEKGEFLCNMCDTKKPEDEKLFCITCETKVCVECYKGMTAVGMTFCPECGDNLIHVKM